jgi:hypothetical protein
VPGIPVLSVDSIGAGSVALSWVLGEIVDAFELQARQPGSDYATVENGMVRGSERSLSVTGLEQGSLYSFRIRALRGDLASDWAKTGNVRTERGTVDPGLSAPEPPVFSVEGVGIGSVSLAWSSTEVVDGFEMELNEAGSGYVGLDSGIFLGSETGVVLEGLLQGTSYTFRLRTVRDGLVSSWTESEAVVTLEEEISTAPPVLEATHFWSFDAVSASGAQDDGLAPMTLDVSTASLSDGIGSTNSGLRLSGNHPGIQIPDSATLNTDVQSELTISLWVRPDAASSTRTSALYEQGSYWRGLNLILENGWIQANGWNLPKNESDWAGTSLQGGQLVVNEWNHLALVLRAGPKVETGGLKLYVNGQLVASGPASQLWKQNDDNGIGQVRQSTNFQGRQVRALDPFQGGIDEVSVWHDALGQQEIQDLILLSSN